MGTILLAALGIYAVVLWVILRALWPRLGLIENGVTRRALKSFLVALAIAPSLVGINHGAVPAPALLVLLGSFWFMVTSGRSTEAFFAQGVGPILATWAIAYLCSYMPTSKYNCKKCGSYMKSQTATGLCEFCGNESDA